MSLHEQNPYSPPILLTISVCRAGVERPPEIGLEAVLNHPVRKMLLHDPVLVVAAPAPLSHHESLVRALDEPAELLVPNLAGKGRKDEGGQRRK